MRDLKIGRKKYKVISEWSEMPCSLASQIFAVEIPENLKEYYKLVIDGDEVKIQEHIEKITSEEQIIEFPNYYKEIIKCFLEIDILPPNKVTWIYQEYFMNFVCGLHFFPNIEPKGIEYVQCGDEKLYLPKSTMVLGTEVPMYDETSESWADSADLQLNCDKFKGGKYEVSNMIVAIVCRPIGEEYDTKKVFERAEKLKDVTMDVVFEVFFCLIAFLLMRNQRDLQSLLKEVQSNRKLPQRIADYRSKVGTAISLICQKITVRLNMLKK